MRVFTLRGDRENTCWHKSIACCNNAVTPVRQQWSYCSLTLSHRNILCIYCCTSVVSLIRLISSLCLNVSSPIKIQFNNGICFYIISYMSPDYHNSCQTQTNNSGLMNVDIVNNYYWHNMLQPLMYMNGSDSAARHPHFRANCANYGIKTWKHKRPCHCTTIKSDVCTHYRDMLNVGHHVRMLARFPFM